MPWPRCFVPHEALANLRPSPQEGAEGKLWASTRRLDYTPERMPRASGPQVVQSYMAHHQGMSLVALTNALFARLMTLRFQAEPMVRAIELLLQERSRAPADRRDPKPAAPAVAGLTSDAEASTGPPRPRPSRTGPVSGRATATIADEPPAHHRRFTPVHAPTCSPMASTLS